MAEIDALDGAQNALSKMGRAYRRGTGCHLTADEIRSLSLSVIGEMWSQDDPRAIRAPAQEPGEQGDDHG